MNEPGDSLREIAIVYALFGDRMAAEAAARAMVEQRLAACANILADCTSFYHWDGRLERAAETPVLFKTSVGRRITLTAALAQDHDYDVPAISSWSAATTADYAAWVETETRL